MTLRSAKNYETALTPALAAIAYRASQVRGRGSEAGLWGQVLLLMLCFSGRGERFTFDNQRRAPSREKPAVSDLPNSTNSSAAHGCGSMDGKQGTWPHGKRDSPAQTRPHG
jgi:hypothetical protein